jgi:hypothetical protein
MSGTRIMQTPQQRPTSAGFDLAGLSDAMPRDTLDMLHGAAIKPDRRMLDGPWSVA